MDGPQPELPTSQGGGIESIKLCLGFLRPFLDPLLGSWYPEKD